jgi:hypothetical protein
LDNNRHRFKWQTLLNKKQIKIPPHKKILRQPANGTLTFAPFTQSQPFGKSQRADSANALTEHSDNKTDFLRILTNYKF